MTRGMAGGESGSKKAGCLAGRRGQAGAGNSGSPEQPRGTLTGSRAAHSTPQCAAAGCAAPTGGPRGSPPPPAAPQPPPHLKGRAGQGGGGRDHVLASRLGGALLAHAPTAARRSLEDTSHPPNVTAASGAPWLAKHSAPARYLQNTTACWKLTADSRRSSAARRASRCGPKPPSATTCCCCCCPTGDGCAWAAASSPAVAGGSMR